MQDADDFDRVVNLAEQDQVTPVARDPETGCEVVTRGEAAWAFGRQRRALSKFGNEGDRTFRIIVGDIDRDGAQIRQGRLGIAKRAHQ